MSLKRSFTRLITFIALVTVLSISSASLAWASGRTILIVDAVQGPFFTIQEALDAATVIEGQVDVLVAPGTYPGRVVIDRPDTNLVGLSAPQHDADGFLVGFADPVIIQNEVPLGFLENVITIKASRVRVEGFTVIRTGGGLPWAATIAASGHKIGDEGEEILEEVVIRNNWLEANPGIAIIAQQANVRVSQNTSTDDGKYGLTAWGGDDALGPSPRVELSQNHFENKDVGIFLIASIWGLGEGQSHGPSSLTVDIRDNKIGNTTKVPGDPNSGSNIMAIFRGTPGFSPSAEARLSLLVLDNLLGEPPENDLATHGGGQNAAQGADPGRMVIHWEGNERFVEGTEVLKPLTARISFKPAVNNPEGLYVQDSTILFVDPTKSLEAIELDLGSPEDGNTFKRVPAVLP